MKLLDRFSLLTVLEEGQPVGSYPPSRRRRAMATARQRAWRHGSLVVLEQRDYEIWAGRNPLRPRQSKAVGRRVIRYWDGRQHAAAQHLDRAAG